MSSPPLSGIAFWKALDSIETEGINAWAERYMTDKTIGTNLIENKSELLLWPENNADIKRLIDVVVYVMFLPAVCGITLQHRGLWELLPLIKSSSFHSACPSNLLSFPALLFFISLPLKPQSSLPPAFSPPFYYYTPATRLICPLNWASGWQSLSLRRHQAGQHPAAAVTGSHRRLEE